MRGSLERYTTKGDERLWRVRWDLAGGPDGRRRQWTRRGFRTPPVGLHWLRPRHATMLLRAGVPILAVAQRLGHANPSITLAVYPHALPADDALAAEATTRAPFAEGSA